jgi:hypothetical protein
MQLVVAAGRHRQVTNPVRDAIRFRAMSLTFSAGTASHGENRSSMAPPRALEGQRHRTSPELAGAASAHQRW